MVAGPLRDLGHKVSVGGLIGCAKVLAYADEAVIAVRGRAIGQRDLRDVAAGQPRHLGVVDVNLIERFDLVAGIGDDLVQELVVRAGRAVEDNHAADPRATVDDLMI